jgi:acetoin utilization protein AcuB
MKKLRVKDWMTDKVLSVGPDVTVTSADVTMEAKHVRRLCVIEDGTLVGIITAGDLRQAKAHTGSVGQPEPVVRDIMSADPISLPENCNIGLAAQTMLEAKISGLPVVDDAGNLVGILSESDIYRFVIEVAREQ